MTVGHRALVAYERVDGRYSLHYSHWGAADLALVADLTRATPFGGDATDDALRAALERLTIDLDETGGLADRFDTAVDPRPVATGVTLETAIADHLDFLHHEAFYRVSPTFEVTAYRTLWFGLQDVARSVVDDPTVGHGALVAPWFRDGVPADDAYLRGWFRGTKELVGALLDAGTVDRAAATAWLRRRVRRWDDPDHDVVIAPRAAAGR